MNHISILMYEKILLHWVQSSIDSYLVTFEVCIVNCMFAMAIANRMIWYCFSNDIGWLYRKPLIHLVPKKNWILNSILQFHTTNKLPLLHSFIISLISKNVTEDFFFFSSLPPIFCLAMKTKLKNAERKKRHTLTESIIAWLKRLCNAWSVY